MSRVKNLVIPVLFDCTAIFLLIYIFLKSDGNPMKFSGSTYGPFFFPVIVLLLLIGFSTITLIRYILQLRSKNQRNNSKNVTLDKKVFFINRSQIRVIFVAFFGLIFSIFWEHFGFLLPSIIFLCLVAYIVGLRSFRGYLIICAITLIAWFVFEHILSISLSF